MGYTLFSSYKDHELFVKTLNVVLEMGNFDENIMLRDFSKFMKKALERISTDEKLLLNLRENLSTCKENSEDLHGKLLGSLSYIVSNERKNIIYIKNRQAIKFEVVKVFLKKRTLYITQLQG